MHLANLRDPLLATNADLSGSQFTNVDLHETRFEDVNLTEAEFTDINFSEAKFSNVNLTKVAIEDCNLEGMKINGVLVTELSGSESVIHLDVDAADRRAAGVRLGRTRRRGLRVQRV